MSTITLNKMVEIPLSPDDFKKFFSGYRDHELLMKIRLNKCVDPTALTRHFKSVLKTLNESSGGQ